MNKKETKNEIHPWEKKNSYLIEISGKVIFPTKLAINRNTFLQK